MKTLLILNDAPYGSERTYNGARLAGALAREDGHEVKVFLIGDAASAAHDKQKVPAGFYNLEVMLGSLANHGGVIGVCGTCMDARGIAAEDLIAGAHRSTLAELTEWTAWADKALVFLTQETTMFFRQRPAANATLSYLFGCAGLQKAVAVDVVAGDEDWFIEEAQRAGAPIVHVIDTHVHADHFSGGPELARRVGASYHLHESNQGRVTFDFSPLHDGQRLEAGNVVVDVVHTPGHTPDSVCLLVRDLRRGDEPWFVLTGDTLFVGAVGRPDLAGREREMAAQLYDTLQQRLLSLPADLEIYPGHQAGSACGAGLSGKPASTIGFEKRFNPMLSMSQEEFVASLTADIPPQPADMARIVEANLRGVLPVTASA